MFIFTRGKIYMSSSTIYRYISQNNHRFIVFLERNTMIRPVLLPVGMVFNVAWPSGRGFIVEHGVAFNSYNVGPPLDRSWWTELQFNYGLWHAKNYSFHRVYKAIFAQGAPHYMLNNQRNNQRVNDIDEEKWYWC